MYCLFRKAFIMRLVQVISSALITISLMIKKLYSELGKSMWGSEAQVNDRLGEKVNDRLGENLLKFTTIVLSVFLQAWNVKKK